MTDSNIQRTLVILKPDAVQRAIVGHHLYQHSEGRHGFALMAAVAALSLDRALARMAKVALRWPRRDVVLAARVEDFAAQARRIDRERCEAMLLAYRLATTPGLRGAGVGGDPALALANAGGERRDDYLVHVRWAEERWGARAGPSVTCRLGNFDLSNFGAEAAEDADAATVPAFDSAGFGLEGAAG